MSGTPVEWIRLDPEWINCNDSCSTAAKKMREVCIPFPHCDFSLTTNAAKSGSFASFRPGNKLLGRFIARIGSTNFLIGVITDRDLVLRVLAKGFVASTTPVNTVMTSPVVAMIYDDANAMQSVS